MSVNEHSHLCICSCFSNPEVQVGIKCAPLTVEASVQCDIECPLFASTPRIDCYSSSESEFSDAPLSADTSTGTI